MKPLVPSIALNVVLLSAGVPAAVADPVLTWNENAAKAATAACLHLSGNGLAESRMYAMVHIAVHDALNAIDRRYRPYAYFGRMEPDASPEAAVAVAAYRTLSRQFTLLIPFGHPSQQAKFDAALATALALIPDGPAKQAGMAVGKRGTSPVSR